MKKNEMKVFHGLVNYGTQAGFLAKGLRMEGVEALSVVYNDSSERLIDINLEKNINSKNRVMRFLKRLFLKFSFFFKYNVFHFYFGQSLFPFNIDLYLYRIFGKKVVMEYLGTDVDLWLGLNGKDWRGRNVDRIRILKKIKRQSKLVDCQLVCAPYYYQFVDNSMILPLAIDLDLYKYNPPKKTDVITIMHCPTNRIAKKSDYIEEALGRLKDEGYKFKYKCIINVTHNQLKNEYLSSDIVIDQLNSWYGTVSIEAMALGRPVICGFYEHLCFYDDRFKELPIINANIYNIYNVLKDVLEGKYDLEDISSKSREFVMKNHNLKSVAHGLINLYESL